ncbi:autophagy protein 5 [Ranunculus cassubicifolius]
MGTEAQSYVWEGAIPLQVYLHESEITTVPSPPPALILAPRIGYLPLLVPLIKPYFSSTLPPGTDTVWFDYKGLPLKWYVPTGVLFDLLCLEPERPWNLTVHFRGYPADLLSPCDGEETVKWSFINSLKEAAYIINGNCKNVMNMSQNDQLELWKSFMNGNMDGNLRISSKLKLSPIEDSSISHGQTSSEPDFSGPNKTGRIPVRLYVRSINEHIDDLEDAPTVDNWDTISYINRPVQIQKDEGKIFTLSDAIKTLLPEFFEDEPSIDEEISRIELEEKVDEQESANLNTVDEGKEVGSLTKAEIKLVRIQGIEPKLDIPFSWVIKNLANPEYFLHICVCVRVGKYRDKTQ